MAKPKPHKGAGRPTKFSPEVGKKICDALRAGNYRHVAAAFAGIGERTFNTWMASKDPAFQQFQRDVITAETEAHVSMVALVAVAAKKDAKHAQWWLERKFHDMWGRKDRFETRHVDKDGKDVSSVFVVPAMLTVDEWQAKYCKAGLSE